MEKFGDFITWAKTVTITVDRPAGVSADDIRYSSIENAREQRGLYRERNNLSFSADIDEWEPADEDDTVVAFLRHNATNYDALLAEMKSRHDDLHWFDDQTNGDPTEDEVDEYVSALNTAYEIIRGRVHAALREKFPEFADSIFLAECRKEWPDSPDE